MAKQPNKTSRFPRHIQKQIKEEVYNLPCDECDHGTMKLKWSNLYSRLFYGCDLYPTCSYTFASTASGAPRPGVDDRPAPTIPKPVRKSQPCTCGGDLHLKWSQSNQSWFYGCTKYPNCRKTKPVDTLLWDFLMQEFPLGPLSSKRKISKKKNRQLEALLDESYLEKWDFWELVKDP